MARTDIDIDLSNVRVSYFYGHQPFIGQPSAAAIPTRSRSTPATS